MSDNKNIKTVIYVLIGFIIGFATHAYLVADDIGEIAEETDVAKIATTTQEIIGDDVLQEEENVQEPVAVQSYQHDAIPNNISIDGYSVSINDQSSGSIVYVSQLELPNEAWVAVREDKGGQLGNILGARKYPSGNWTGVIELIRGTEPGSVYYVVFYGDDGDAEFDYKKDKILLNSDNKVVAVKFRTY